MLGRICSHGILIRNWYIEYVEMIGVDVVEMNSVYNGGMEETMIVMRVEWFCYSGNSKNLVITGYKLMEKEQFGDP